MTMESKMRMIGATGVLAALLAGAACASGRASRSAAGDAGDRAEARSELVREAKATVADFKEADPGLSRFFGSAEGYAVFPSVGKGAFGIGGAYGRGVLFEDGKPTGRVTLTQVTVGAQLGGQAYSEIVFFESEEALGSFKKGQLAMAAQVSAVAAATGTSANARYSRGVAVFTLAKGGLMAEVSVGGQKFGFEPFGKAM